MLYSLMSTKFRRAFRRILSCNRSPMYDPRETTCATPSVSHMASTRVTKVNNGEKTAKRPYSERNGLLAVTDNKVLILFWKIPQASMMKIRLSQKSCKNLLIFEIRFSWNFYNPNHCTGKSPSFNQDNKIFTAKKP